MMKLVQLLIPCTIITIAFSSITAEDITTISEFEAYNNRSRNICTNGDVSQCPVPDRSVCLNDYCYKTCSSNTDCAAAYTCSYENLCKPKGCHPCINGPTYNTTTTSSPDEDLDLDASAITTVDEWEEYLRKSDSYCPSGEVSECRKQKRHICLDGKCFKRCEQDSQCAAGFTCNWEKLCKPENCTPCIRKTMYPTAAETNPVELEHDHEDVLAVMDGDGINEEKKLLSTALLFKMMVFVGLGVMIFWIWQRLMTKNENEKIGEYGPSISLSTKYGATSSV